MALVDGTQFRPEAGTQDAGGVNRRISSCQIPQAGGRHNGRASVSPSGLNFNLLAFRWLTPPATNVPASGLKWGRLNDIFGGLFRSLCIQTERH